MLLISCKMPLIAESLILKKLNVKKMSVFELIKCS